MGSRHHPHHYNTVCLSQALCASYCFHDPIYRPPPSIFAITTTTSTTRTADDDDDGADDDDDNGSQGHGDHREGRADNLLRAGFREGAIQPRRYPHIISRTTCEDSRDGPYPLAHAFRFGDRLSLQQPSYLRSPETSATFIPTIAFELMRRAAACGADGGPTAWLAN